MLEGIIVKNISDTYTVKVKETYYECKARGKFRNIHLTPLVGDKVQIDPQKHYILTIQDRKNELTRPSISNVDIALIITSVKKPDLSLYLLDKQISNIILAKVKPVLCFTKLDLLNKAELKALKKIMKYYQKLGFQVYTNQKLKPLLKTLKGKVVVLTGQTGAGKSSLLNKIDNKLNLKTGSISEALGRGRHTTRHTEFFFVHNIYFADTPGFSALDLTKYSKEEIRDSFKEFSNYTCEFKNCMHTKENNCEIKKQVKKGNILSSRYENYCNFIK